MHRNMALQLFQRELGNKYSQSYDFVLPKLKCFVIRDERSSPIFGCKFAKCPRYEDVLAVCAEDGRVTLTKSMEDRDVEIDSFVGHLNAVFDIDWMDGEMKFVTAAGDQSCALWEMIQDKPYMVSRFLAHERSVKVVAFAPNSKDIFVSGGRDGTIYLWDVRVQRRGGKQVAENKIQKAHGIPAMSVGRYSKRPQPIFPCSITGLDFYEPHIVVSCAAGDRFVKLWDMRRPYSAFSGQPRPLSQLAFQGKGVKGYSHLLIERTTSRLFVNAIDNSIDCFNLASSSDKPVWRYVGHDNSSNYIKSCLSPDGRYLISGSGDGSGSIWRIGECLKPQPPIVKLRGHRRELTCVAWCRVGGTKIYSCGDDGKLMRWEIGTEEDEDRLLLGQAEVDEERLTHEDREEEEWLALGQADIEEEPRFVYICEELGIGVTPTHCCCRKICTDIVCIPPKPESNVPAKRQRCEPTSTITSNLPNFVIDGTSPNGPWQPRIQPKENNNWLTQLSKKFSKPHTSRNEDDLSPQSCPKPDDNMSPHSCQSRPKPRILGSKARSKVSLLQYFTVVQKPAQTTPSNGLIENGSKYPDAKPDVADDDDDDNDDSSKIERKND